MSYILVPMGYLDPSLPMPDSIKKTNMPAGRPVAVSAVPTRASSVL
jgi:hypothetical protein